MPALSHVPAGASGGQKTYSSGKAQDSHFIKKADIYPHNRERMSAFFVVPYRLTLGSVTVPMSGNTYDYMVDTGRVVLIINASFDRVDEIKLFAPGFNNFDVYEYNRFESGCFNKDIKYDGNSIFLKSGILGMETKVYFFKERK